MSEITETGTAKGDVSAVEPSRVQQVLARRVAEAKATVPEHVLVAEIDLESAQATGVPIIDLAITACALALRDVPQANASYKDGRYERYTRVNVGIAMTEQDAIVIPTIFDADHKAPAEIGTEREALRAKVHAGEITAAEVGSATFTIHDLQIDAGTAIVQAPQAATLALGAAVPRVVARDGAPAVRHTAIATLTCDHRVLYGAHATRFLACVRERLEQAERLLG